MFDVGKLLFQWEIFSLISENIVGILAHFCYYLNEIKLACWGALWTRAWWLCLFKHLPVELLESSNKSLSVCLWWRFQLLSELFIVNNLRLDVIKSFAFDGVRPERSSWTLCWYIGFFWATIMVACFTRLWKNLWNIYRWIHALSCINANFRNFLHRHVLDVFDESLVGFRFALLFEHLLHEVLSLHFIWLAWAS